MCEKELHEPRVEHSLGHFKPLADAKSLDDEDFSQCDLCIGFPAFDDVGELRQHHLQEHIKVEPILSSLNSAKDHFVSKIEKHMKTEGPNMKCIYCPHALSVGKDDDMINHLVDEEYILEVEVLKYIKENKMKFISYMKRQL